MKKEFGKLALLLSLITFGMPANASFWDLWKNEDEEPMSVSKTKQDDVYHNQKANKNVEQPMEYVQESTQNINIVNETPTYDVNSINNSYGSVDYDTLQSERMLNRNEISNAVNKWKQGNVNIFWENYRGNNIRIEMLRNNRDLKEMRLKFVQSQNMTSDPDGSISDMLNVVANQVMKRTCGKKAKQSIILYERPSIELERETSADGYKVMAKGTSIKEYGYRCIY